MQENKNVQFLHIRGIMEENEHISCIHNKNHHHHHDHGYHNHTYYHEKHSCHHRPKTLSPCPTCHFNTLHQTFEKENYENDEQLYQEIMKKWWWIRLNKIL
jgi:hypothetical protein